MHQAGFAIDSMLGNVVRELRLLGYDALYLRSGSDAEKIRIVRREQRLLVSRDKELLRRAGYVEKLGAVSVVALYLEESKPYLQTARLLRTIGRDPRTDGVETLSRCLVCGPLLVEATLAEVRGRVPVYVAKTQERFSTCGECGRIYWRGTHANRLLKRAGEIAQSVGAVKERLI